MAPLPRRPGPSTVGGTVCDDQRESLSSQLKTKKSWIPGRVRPLQLVQLERASGYPPLNLLTFNKSFASSLVFQKEPLPKNGLDPRGKRHSSAKR